MSVLSTALENYLTLRRSMGFKLERAGKLLAQFVAYCEAAGASTITIELALGWATLPQGRDPNWATARLSVVRSFAKHVALLDERTEVPPADLLPARSHRASPYLYSEDEVRKLMVAAGKLRSPLRRATLQTLLGLLWVSGMRIGEALRLDREDVDLVRGVLFVRDSKFGSLANCPFTGAPQRRLAAMRSGVTSCAR